MENNFKNYLIFRENKLSSTNLREQIIHYIIITILIYSHASCGPATSLDSAGLESRYSGS